MSDAHKQGHNEPCFYCGKACDCFAGNPALWPIPVCHSGAPGAVKWHHTGCVSERLEKIERLEAENKKCRDERDLFKSSFEHWNRECHKQSKLIGEIKNMSITQGAHSNREEEVFGNGEYAMLKRVKDLIAKAEKESG